MFISCVTIAELERRLAVFTAEQPVDRFTISKDVAAHFQVELVLKPNIPITERLIFRLEAALQQEIRALSLFRIHRDVFIVRFTVSRSYDDASAADRVEEFPTAYAWVG